MNKVSWTIFAVVTVSILGLLVFFSKSETTTIDVSKTDITSVQKGNNDNGNIADHVFGKEGSKVTLIEYGDFQCPGCGDEHPVVKAIIEKYKDQLQFVFRNFPLVNAHANAKAAASATEAAGLQGKYWEMHDKVYESQDDWNTLTGQDRTDKFVSYADILGLDTDKFRTDMASEEVSAKINYDYELSKKAGVKATPTFYLNGTNIDSETWSDEAKFKAAINAELKKANIALPEGEE